MNNTTVDGEIGAKKRVVHLSQLSRFPHFPDNKTEAKKHKIAQSRKTDSALCSCVDEISFRGC